MNLKIDAVEIIGRNDHWQFAIAKVGDRWLGVALESQSARAARAAFASEGLSVENSYMHVFGEVSDGVDLGQKDKREAMLLTGALAQDPEQGFGGVDEWLVPAELRGDPDQFRCRHCSTVGCNGRDCEEFTGLDGYYDDEGDCE